jgi:MoxR-like ATPase
MAARPHLPGTVEAVDDASMLTPLPDTGAQNQSSWPPPDVMVASLCDELATVVVGQNRVLERLVVCLLAGGHALLEGVPGVGKTLTLATLAKVVGGSFHRIQFTPDLLPSDIVGTRVYKASSETFEVEPGPIFANFVLADEINRAPAKVQSALLEVMAERQVTIGGRTMEVPDPFLVLATQNPVESEGVYPLPEAQRDRFMMRIMVPLPTAAEERAIVDRMYNTAPVPSQQLSLDQLRALQQLTRVVSCPPSVVDYAVRLTLATRDPEAARVAALVGRVRHGASPRATISLVRAARAMAVLRGRLDVTAQDVYDVAFDVLNHRLMLTYDALADGVSPAAACTELVRTVPAPRAGR